MNKKTTYYYAECSERIVVSERAAQRIAAELAREWGVQTARDVFGSQFVELSEWVHYRGGEDAREKLLDTECSGRARREIRSLCHRYPRPNMPW